MSHKPITLGRLPRVLLRALALDAEDRATVAVALRSCLLPHEAKMATDAWADSACHRQAILFASVARLKKERRRAIVDALDKALDAARERGEFGYKGERDPRGVGR